MTQIFAKMVGGPLDGREHEIPHGAVFGQIIEVPFKKETSGVVKIEQRSHYRIDTNPYNKEVVLNWINPADRRQYGS